VETENIFNKVLDFGPSYKRCQMENSKDLRSFVSRGTPAKYSDRKVQHRSQLYNQQKSKVKPKNSQYHWNLTSRPSFEGIVCGKRSESLPGCLAREPWVLEAVKG